MSIALSIQNFTKHYGDFKAVDNLCLEVQEGEFFGFLGPNGAGKTSTINAITGLGNYSEGSIQILGHDVMKEYKVTRKLLGLAPQEVNFDPFLDIRQMLFYTGGYYGLGRKEAGRRADELLHEFHIWEHRKLGFKQLSGGLKRRLLIARALVHKPKVLILDEPTAGVDLELRYQLWDTLREMNRAGTTIILTTHYIEEAERLCERIGIINKGKLVACDRTEDLIQQMNRDTLVVRIKEELREIPTGLKQYKVRIEENGKSLLFEEEKATLNDILKAIQSEGIVIERIDLDPATLEDVFTDMTKVSV
jgi:ABC-2 type transport system ATP-binding protein